MFNHIQQQLSQHLPHHSHFLIGLSGGVDSVVLLHLFQRLRQSLALEIRAIHIHHGISPNADHWATFCQQLCQQWQIPCQTQWVKLSNSQNLEAQAREARYQAIAQHILPKEILVTAHHQDDQVETFLLALKRGSGIKGLGAMQAVSFRQNFAIFRPLLTLSKQQILAYAHTHQLSWIEDESNQNNHYDRNFLRLDVLPLLNQRWQQFNQMVARSSQHCAEQQQLIEELLNEELQKRYNPNQHRLDIHNIAQFSQAKTRQLLRLWLEKTVHLNPTLAQLTQLIEKVIYADADKNPQIKIGQQIIRRYQSQLFITQEIAPIPALEIPLAPLTSGQNSANFYKLPADLGEVQRTKTGLYYQKQYFPLPTPLLNQPLIIKFNQQGKIKQYGKTQREELKKIWQQNSVPIWQRNRTPLLFWQDQFVMLLKATENVER